MNAAGEAGFSIRPGKTEDIAKLQELERDAAARFRALPDLPPVPDDVTSSEELEEAVGRGLVWVAEVDGEVAGYAYAAPLEGNLHLEEVSVSRAFGRRGIGRALVRGVIERAKNDGCAGVTLTTFRDVPWNAPFYARMGFRVLEEEELGAGLRAAIEAEGKRGLPVGLRVAMAHDLDGARGDQS